MLKPIPPPSDPKVKPDDVTVIIPCLDYNEKLARTITSIIANCPRKIILVTIATNRDKLEEMMRKVNSGSVEIKVETVQKPSKRKQMAAGIRLVETDLIVFADDDVDWPSGALRWIAAPFEVKSEIGAVATCQRLQHNDTQHWSQRIWRFLGALYLERRNFDCAATNYMDGGIPCISGRTAAYRTSIVKNKAFLQAFCSETWKGNTLNPDDDNFLTRWVIRQGWRIFFQKHPETLVQTTLEESPKYLQQCLRWSRSNWRSNLRSLTQWVIWWRHPYSTYAVFLTTPLLPPALAMDGLLIWQCHRATKHDYTLHYQSLVLLLGWMLISKIIKFLDYYRRYPSDIILLPVSILFGYAHGIIKIYALFTLHVV